MSEADIARINELEERTFHWEKVGSYPYTEDFKFLLMQLSSTRASELSLQSKLAQAEAEVTALKAGSVIATEMVCKTCGTAAYQPFDRCKDHISWKDALQTEVEMHNAWRKRGEEAEARIEELEKAGKALVEHSRTEYSRDHGEPDPSPAFPIHIKVQTEAWQDFAKLLKKEGEDGKS